MPRDKRLDNPAFREAHKVVSKVWKEIKKSKWGSVDELRYRAAQGLPEAKDLLARYEKALADRRATTAKGA